MNDNIVEEMKKMRENGYTLKEIADKFGVSISTVYDYVRGIKYKHRSSYGFGKRLGDDDVNRIYSMWKDGYKISEIAKVLGVHYQTVYRYVRRFNNDMASKQ